MLIALIDPTHVQHDAAHGWFAVHGKRAWATCPLTENGVLRIVGHTRYPNSPGTPAEVAQLMKGLRALPGYVFWPDKISLLDTEMIDTERLLNSGQVTDSAICWRWHALTKGNWRASIGAWLRMRYMGAHKVCI